MKNDIVVTTALQLDEAEKKDILKDLHSYFSFDDARFYVDARILGGVKIAFQDKVIDCSIERKLHAICNALIQSK